MSCIPNVKYGYKEKCVHHPIIDDDVIRCAYCGKIIGEFLPEEITEAVNEVIKETKEER